MPETRRFVEIDAHIIRLRDAGNDGVKPGFSPLFNNRFEELFADTVTPVLFADVDRIFDSARVSTTVRPGRKRSPSFDNAVLNGDDDGVLRAVVLKPCPPVFVSVSKVATVFRIASL
jgi:hypothetical protein